MMELLKSAAVKWIIGLFCVIFGGLWTATRTGLTAKAKKLLLADVTKDIAGLNKKLNAMEEKTSNSDKKLADELCKLRSDMFAILTPLRDAQMSSMLDKLIEKCKVYVHDGEISVDDLDRLEKDYQTYKNLNGNGHMEAWMNKVRHLKAK